MVLKQDPIILFFLNKKKEKFYDDDTTWLRWKMDNFFKVIKKKETK